MRLSAAVLCTVDAARGVRLPVALEVAMVRPLDQMPQLGAGVRRPGVREERDVEVVVVLRRWSGAFL